MKYFRFFCITLLLLLLTSCQNFFSGSDDSSSSSKSAKNFVSFTGNICLEGAYPQEFVPAATSASTNTRTAFPSLPANAVYRITASKNNTIVYDSTANDTDIQIAADKSSFTIKQLATGANWNITVAIYESSDTDFSAPLMSDSYPFTPSEENNVLTHDFELKPVLTGGKGSVSLILTYPAGAFDDFSFTCLSSNSDKWTCLIDNTLNNCVILCNTNGDNEIETGSYVIQFDFKKAGIVLYSDIQTINIFKNMKTNTWVNNGGSGPVQSDGTYQVTQAMIDSYAQTQIYVGQNKYSTSFGTGSKFSPYARLSDAFRYIAATGNSTTNYTIWVSGGWTSDEEKGGYIREITKIDDTYSLDGKSKSITIQGLNGLDSNGDPLDYLEGFADKLNNNYDFKNFDYDFIHSTFNDGEEFAPVLTIDYPDTSTNTLDIRLKNIGIRKGVANEGAGLKLIGTKLKLTINDGVKISGNYSGNSAGGLYIEKATVIMNGGKISSNKTYNSNTNAESSGGAIRLANSGKFTLNDGEISYNLAHKYGGAISLITSGSSASGNSFTMNGGKICYNSTASIYGYGGAVYLVNGTFTMTAGEISSNSSSNEAGAVYINGPEDSSATFDMQGGLIKDNTFNGAPDTSKTSAIYLNKGTFKMKGNSFIPKSNAKHIVYLASGKTINITGSLTPKSTGTASGTAETVAAVINLADTYTADLPVLSGSNLNAASEKMRMTAQGWLISQGKLTVGVIATTSELQELLTNLSANSTSTPYTVIITDSAPNFSDLKNAINNCGKYINLSFSNATFTSLNNNLSSNKIVNITIPASVTSASGFSKYYSNLQNIYVESNNNNYKSLNGVLYSHDGKTLVDYPRKKTGTTYTIPENTENIGSNAFYGNTTITSITIPDYVQAIGESAFESATALASVSLGTGITNLRSRVFYGTTFTTITLPASIETIGSNTQPFYANEDLQEIIVDSENQNFKSVDGVVYSKDGKELCIYPSAKADTSYTILSGTTSIRYESFHKTANLTKISIPEGITEIVGNAFRECTKIETVVLPSTMTTIQRYAFAVSHESIQTVYFRGTEEQQTALKDSIQNKDTGLPSTGWVWGYSDD